MCQSCDGRREPKHVRRRYFLTLVLPSVPGACTIGEQGVPYAHSVAQHLPASAELQTVVYHWQTFTVAVRLAPCPTECNAMQAGDRDFFFLFALAILGEPSPRDLPPRVAHHRDMHADRCDARRHCTCYCCAMCAVLVNECLSVH